MIKAVFSRDPAGAFQQFKLTGHADSGDYGHDIVCAAVSAVTIGIANSIEVMAGFDPVTFADEVNGGHIEASIPTTLTAEAQRTTQTLLESLYLTLSEIAQDHHDYVHVVTHTHKA
ncbi:ribosomal-processing cysteine protease Prp [Lacticaseibacillus daqingensis]|uniref:ribosomal-processing cysteine protease Prp n=1 Tax=Lacticaseibacillus daqingensis TaxID=2486014 RepID=UPI000F76CC24|nr:ribosomal-processing cysteine protease Prp [Lacticaseibacillus daqingensis]